MKRIATLIMTASLIAGAAVAGEGDGHHAKEAVKAKIIQQTTCPVMGGKVNRDLYVDHDGKRVYVCCKGCVETVKRNPGKWIKKLESEGVTVAKVQTTCPVMGGKIDKKQYVDVKGKRLYVCCPGCSGKIKADPAPYIRKLEQAGIVLDTPTRAMAHKEGHDGHKGHNH